MQAIVKISRPTAEKIKIYKKLPVGPIRYLHLNGDRYLSGAESAVRPLHFLHRKDHSRFQKKWRADPGVVRDLCPALQEHRSRRESIASERQFDRNYSRYFSGIQKKPGGRRRNDFDGALAPSRRSHSAE